MGRKKKTEVESEIIEEVVQEEIPNQGPQEEVQLKPRKKKTETSESKKEDESLNKEPDKKLTTTKKILILTWVTFLGLVILQICGKDVGIALEIVGGAMTSIITSVYLFKSKAENKVKISYGMIDKLADKYGIENVINLLQNILND